MPTLYDLLLFLIEKVNKSVKTDTMILTDEQKTQVRANIDALGKDYVPPNQTAEQVGADPKGTASNAVTTHNSAVDSHGDIRLLIQTLTTRLDTLANSEDVDLDQLSEIVAYIKSNKNLIDGITTNKVNVTDIVNNLTTNVDNKPLSAGMGVVLKRFIDEINLALAKKPDLTESEIDTLAGLIQ